MSNAKNSTIISSSSMSDGYIYHDHYNKVPVKTRPLGTIDEDGKIEMGHNNIHIQPTNNGFIVTFFSKEEGASFYNCMEFSEVVKFISDHPIMDRDNEEVADNV